jgi:hypothetical protein
LSDSILDQRIAIGEGLDAVSPIVDCFPTANYQLPIVDALM